MSFLKLHGIINGFTIYGKWIRTIPKHKKPTEPIYVNLSCAPAHIEDCGTVTKHVSYLLSMYIIHR